MTEPTRSTAEKNYRLEEAARVVDFSPHTLRKWYKQGRLRGFKMGNRIFIPQSVLDEMVDRAKSHG